MGQILFLKMFVIIIWQLFFIRPNNVHRKENTINVRKKCLLKKKKRKLNKEGFCCDFWRFVSIPPSQAQRLLNKIHIGPFLNIFQKQFDGILL